MTETLTIDVADAPAGVDLSTAAHWHILLLRAGTPAARIDIAGPGASSGDALLRAAVLRWGDWDAAREQLAARLRARMSLPAPPGAPVLSCSVVVCTHRRPEDLRRLLAALVRLDPPPAEIVVVDNDPGEHDSRAEVLAAGARYVREDRRGLDNARNAGVRAAHGDLVAFIDDDCVPSAGWLRRLAQEFSNPAVGAVTGPAFPHVLDTPSRKRMEVQASLTRGLQRTEFDWTVFPIAGAGAVGVGANMAFRRDALRELGPEPFPSELDAGTATESGGDTYAIAKLLAHGHRIVYDPATFVYHRHRQDARALHRAVVGYGIGLSAALTKLLLEDRELSTPASWTWVLGQYRRTQQRRLAGRADNVETRLSWDYLRGGLIGPGRWLRTRGAAAHGAQASAEAARRLAGTAGTNGVPSALARAGGLWPSDAAGHAGSAPRARRDGTPAISVVVPTHERPRALDRCLRALAAQDLDAPFEVLVVDDSAAASAQIDDVHRERLHLRVLRTHGSGAAEARNTGAAAAAAPLLLFIDDDVIAAPELLRCHRDRHAEDRDGRLALVGAYLPRPATPTLAASAAALWWNDLFDALGRAETSTYVGALTGNLSIAKDAFAQSGGFDKRFARYRREDWEWGLRALARGIELRYEPAAAALHEYELTAAGRLRAARLEGYGDVLLLREHPEAAAAVLPLVGEHLAAAGRCGALRRAAWGKPSVRRVVLLALSALERARLRLLWVRLFNVAQRLSYAAGVAQAGRSPLEPVPEPLIDVDLDGDAPIALPLDIAAVATLRVRVGGREVARVRPALAQWTSDVAEQVVAQTPWEDVERAALAGGCFPEWDESHTRGDDTQVLALESEEGPGGREAGEGSEIGEVGEAAGDAAQEEDAVASWRDLLANAAREDTGLVAITMPGVHGDRRWLEEALVAFDGARVGVAIGCALADDAPAVPLLLQSEVVCGLDRPLEGAVSLHYLVLRRDLLDGLDPELARHGLLAPALALLEDALVDGWVLGYRDVHGLHGDGPGRAAGTRALSALRMHRSGEPAATAIAELRRTTLGTAWHFARRRERRGAVEAYVAALGALLSALRGPGSPAPDSASQRCSGTTSPLPPTGPSTRSG